MIKLVNYVKESYAELRRVTWPTKQQVINYTLAVIVASAAFAAFLGIMDLVFSKVIKRVIF